MSHPQFSSGPSGMLIELDINTSNIWGRGDANYPCIGWQVPMFISFHQKQVKRYAFRGAGAQLQLNGTKIADSHPVSMDRMLRHGESKHTEYLNLEFPVSNNQIRAIEDFRQGGSLKLQLWVQLHIDEYRPVSVMGGGEVWELEKLSWAQVQPDIEISQTHWVERVLPHIGYGKIHVVEFPAVPLAACQSLERSFKALKQAEEKHRLGFYDDAVGKCRMALEKFFDYVPVDPHPESRKIPVLKRSWERKLGKATYDWLNGALGGIKDASNPTHHSPDAHYDQFESQMILAITTAVVAYIARAPELQEPE